MKNFTKLTWLCRMLLAVVLVLPMTVSCMDEINALKDKVNELANRFNQLELRLNDELAALEDLINGKVTITQARRNDDGSYGIELSSGVNFTVYPKTEQLKSVVTYVTLGGVNYWAYYDKDGNPQLLLNEKGERVPVAVATPEVITRDEELYLVIGSKEYPLDSGNTVFTDYQVHTDDLTGEVQAVTFTFGEGMTFTITVDGYQGLTFVIQRVWDYVPVYDYFVAYGTTERVTVKKPGVMDYVLQIPDGWRVTETYDEFMMETYFNITAPSAEAVKAGAASEGELKVLSVLQGGKASVSKLYLSADAFSEVSVKEGNAVTKMYTGLQKFVYGVCLSDDYNEETLLETAAELLYAYDYPAGYGVSDMDLNTPLTEIYGQELVPGETYTFWAVPALYYSTNDDAGYYVKEGTFAHKEFSYVDVTFEVANPTFRDAEVTLDAKGVDTYYAGIMNMSEYAKDDVVLYLNYGVYEPITYTEVYSGSAFEFGNVEAESEMNTTYLVWFAVAEEGKNYTAADVMFREFTTSGLEAGSDVVVTTGQAELTSSAVSVPVTAEGAGMIFYSFVKYSNAGRYPDDAAKTSYVLANGTCITGNAGTAVVEQLDQLETVYLYAVAVDENGKYGNVYVEEFTTLESIFNDMQVKLEIVRNNPYDVAMSVEVTGGEPESFVYWIGKSTDNFWKSSSNLGGTREKAQDFIAANPNNAKLATAMRKYTYADGQITMTDLALETEYVAVVMAKDTEEHFSEATVLVFRTRAVNLGAVIYSTNPVWAAYTPQIEWLENTFIPATGFLSGAYSFNVTIPEGLTAYVLAGTEAYFNEGDETTEIAVEDKLIAILDYSDRQRDVANVVSEDEWIEKGYPYGHEFLHYCHGYPPHGYGVIWADKDTHDNACDVEEPDTYVKTINGVDVTFTSITMYNTGEPVSFRMPEAITTDDVDKVYVVYKDSDGNYFEPYVIDVPDEYFSGSNSRD